MCAPLSPLSLPGLPLTLLHGAAVACRHYTHPFLARPSPSLPSEVVNERVRRHGQLGTQIFPIVKGKEWKEQKAAYLNAFPYPEGVEREGFASTASASMR